MLITEEKNNTYTDLEQKKQTPWEGQRDNRV